MLYVDIYYTVLFCYADAYNAM
eukprot:COSAG06_NODE_30273_length_541_cov_1.789593_1_plen_21_part_10